MNTSNQPRTASPRRRVSLGWRLAGVVGVFLSIMLISVGLSALMIRSWDRSLDERSDLRQIATEVAALRLAYSDQETGVRGYQLTGENTFLEPYDEGVESAAASLSMLDDVEIVSVDFPAHLAEVESAAATWTALVAEPIVSGSSEQPDEDESLEVFDTLRTRLDALDADVSGRLEQLVERAERARRSTIGVLIATALAALGGALLIALLFRRWVLDPLGRVSSGARAVAADHTGRLPDFDTPEFQDVTDAIRSLQRSLEGARDRAIAAYSGLEQSAVLAVQVRSELANELGELPEGWSADSFIQPAEGVVAGDCYDVGLLNESTLYVIMIDVTGHGATAALDALKAKSQLRAALRSRLAPGAAIDWLSRENRRDDGADLLTAVVATIDIATGACTYANAGHPPPMITDGSTVTMLDPTGPLVGAFPTSWESATCCAPPGSTLFLYTDGVTDVVGDERDRFGQERLVELVQRVAGADGEPEATITELRRALDEFRAGPRADDVTAVAIRHEPADRLQDEFVDDRVDTVRP